jgi:hypothetical protein
MLDTLQYEWPRRQTLGKWLENKCPTNDGQHSCRRNWVTSSFWCLHSSSSFCHRRVRKIILKIILPIPLSWPDLTIIKWRRDWSFRALVISGHPDHITRPSDTYSSFPELLCITCSFHWYTWVLLSTLHPPYFSHGLFASLKRQAEKYCSLICYERKTLYLH